MARTDIDAAIAMSRCKDSNISVVMNRRFHWDHPEFSSSASDATFDTLTRFYVSISQESHRYIHRLL